MKTEARAARSVGKVGTWKSICILELSHHLGAVGSRGATAGGLRMASRHGGLWTLCFPLPGLLTTTQLPAMGRQGTRRGTTMAQLVQAVGLGQCQHVQGKASALRGASSLGPWW